ncbi:hypothetical protein PQU92_11430 [Asticcacaulis sp. BYS171W]|uniref:Uncharacterized protein n=1 Tax=Asticcacaulis aquaticus TaxID=2984212 RepID=A0ABT5HUZ4_9CAUL|nr:hypothetical protein [Asticcacaulis aquaticus]MDC7683890.1 hypothetical protein [Asticcacaulis aquaticus]
MSGVSPERRHDASVEERLVIEREDAVTIVERLRETHADADGHAFLLKLDALIVRLGAKWDAKSELVFEHLKTGFERRFQEPNWCLRINDDAWLAIIPSVGARRGALAVTEMWRELGNFFVGDVSHLETPLYEVLVEDVDRFMLRPIDLKTWFDRPEVEAAKLKPIAGETTPEAVRGPGTGPQMTNIQRPVIVAATVTHANRTLRVASSNEPLFEMKKMVMIGHRLEPMVMEAIDNALLDRKALAAMDWGLREQIDITNIEQGLKILKMREAEQRKMLMVVPAAFSTFASQRARQKIMHDVSKAAAEMGLKVLFEIRGLDGVPPHRVLEIVSLIKPFCMTVVGHVSADRKAIAALNKCGLSGICVEYDGQKRDDEALQEYLTQLSVAAKASAGACMVQGFDNYRQMAVARLAGVTHASIKAAAMMSPRGAVAAARTVSEGLTSSAQAQAALSALERPE